MNPSNPSRTALAVLAVALLVSKGRAQSTADVTRAERKPVADAAEKGLNDFCGEVETWKVRSTAPLIWEGELNQRQKEQKKREAEEDADVSKGWDENTQGKVRAVVKQIRENCQRLKASNGIGALTKSGAKLENITGWLNLTEQFDLLLHHYRGWGIRANAAKSENSSCYKNNFAERKFFKKGAKEVEKLVRLDRQNTIKVMAEFAIEPLIQAVESGDLAKAAAQAK